MLGAVVVLMAVAQAPFSAQAAGGQSTERLHQMLATLKQRGGNGAGGAASREELQQLLAQMHGGAGGQHQRGNARMRDLLRKVRRHSRRLHASSRIHVSTRTAAHAVAGSLHRRRPWRRSLECPLCPCRVAGVGRGAPQSRVRVAREPPEFGSDRDA